MPQMCVPRPHCLVILESSLPLSCRELACFSFLLPFSLARTTHCLRPTEGQPLLGVSLTASRGSELLFPRAHLFPAMVPKQILLILLFNTFSTFSAFKITNIYLHDSNELWSSGLSLSSWSLLPPNSKPTLSYIIAVENHSCCWQKNSVSVLPL